MATTAEAPVGEVARRALDDLEHAWNAGDGAMFATAYTDTATFVNIRGDLIVGRAAIEAGHAAIFATTHADSVNRLELVDGREIGDGVVIAVSRNTLTAPHGPLQGMHDALSTSVIVRVGGQWRIAATHNTLVGAR